MLRYKFFLLLLLLIIYCLCCQTHAIGINEKKEVNDAISDFVSRAEPGENLEEVLDRTRRIVNGTTVFAPSYMASLAYTKANNNYVHYCAGVFIHEKYVLTAAHCVDEQYILTDVVFQGASTVGNGNNIFGGSRFFPITNYFKHQLYNSDTRINDIAVLQLGRDAFNSQPVMLSDDSSYEQTGRNATVYGYGKTSANEGLWSDSLRKVTIPVVEKNTCRKAYDFYNDRTSLCAGFETGYYDVCSGDNGGPLLVEEPNNVDINVEILIGIVSRPESCGIPGEYGLYTRVRSYLLWLSGLGVPYYVLNGAGERVKVEPFGSIISTPTTTLSPSLTVITIPIGNTFTTITVAVTPTTTNSGTFSTFTPFPTVFPPTNTFPPTFTFPTNTPTTPPPGPTLNPIFNGTFPNVPQNTNVEIVSGATGPTFVPKTFDGPQWRTGEVIAQCPDCPSLPYTFTPSPNRKRYDMMLPDGTAAFTILLVAPKNIRAFFRGVVQTYLTISQLTDQGFQVVQKSKKVKYPEEIISIERCSENGQYLISMNAPKLDEIGFGTLWYEEVEEMGACQF
eukprot:Awhi_evm2s12838